MNDDIKKPHDEKEARSLFNDFLWAYLINLVSKKDEWASAMMEAAIGVGFETTFEQDEVGFIITVKPFNDKKISQILDEMISGKEATEVH